MILEIEIITKNEQFEDILTRYSSEQYIFRGMTNSNWKIESSIYRYLKDRYPGIKIDEDPSILHKYQNILIQKARDDVPQTNTPDILILSYLQHFGGNTCLIDFSTDLKKAFYFACEKDFDKDGVVYIMDREVLDQISNSGMDGSKIRSLFPDGL